MTVTTAKIQSGYYTVMVDGVLAGYIYTTGKYNRIWVATNVNPFTGEVVGGGERYRTNSGLKPEAANAVARRFTRAAPARTKEAAVAQAEATGQPLFTVTLPQDLIDAVMAARAATGQAA